MNNTNNFSTSAGQFITGQLSAAGVTLADLDDQGLLEAAGGGLSVRWLKLLIDGQVNKLTIRQLIGLRRLFAEPIDTIIGLGYLQPECHEKQAGLKRIALEIGGDYKRSLWKRLCLEGGCSSAIIARIIQFSAWSVIEHASNINTPAEDVRLQLLSTFSLPILVRLKYALHTNIDDILGLGEYDEESVYLVTNGVSTKDVKAVWTEGDARRKRTGDAAKLAAFNRNRATQPAGGEITGFRPLGDSEAI
jgi:hypothetical protein